MRLSNLNFGSTIAMNSINFQSGNQIYARLRPSDRYLKNRYEKKELTVEFANSQYFFNDLSAS
jgi:hypothetical protein